MEKQTPNLTELTSRIYSSKRLDQAKIARQVLETICRHTTFVPDQYDWGEPIQLRFDPRDLSGPVAALINQEGNKLNPQDPSGRILLKRRQKPKCNFNMSWSGMRLHPVSISFYDVEEQYTRKSNGLQEWLDFSFSLFVEQDAWYGAIALREEYTAKHRLIYTMPANAPSSFSPGATVEAGLGAKLYENIPGVYWGTYFSPFYIEWLGRKRFATVPSVEQRWLPNGGVFITTAALPSEWQKPEVQALQRQVREHLGADAFFDIDEVRATFTQQLGKNNVFDPDQVMPRYRRPEFPFDEAYNARLAEVALYQRDAIIQDQIKLGFRFVEETASGSLVFQSKEGDRVVIDPVQRTLQHYPKA